MLTLLEAVALPGCDCLSHNQVSAPEVRWEWYHTGLFLGGIQFWVIPGKGPRTRNEEFLEVEQIKANYLGWIPASVHVKQIP